ncbi:Acid phosphatase [Bertholletia excelsa]
MTMKAIMALVFLLATLAATSQAKSIPYQIYPLRLRSGSAGQDVAGASCLSWRFGVETHNIRDWDLVPEECGDYIGHYMLGDQFLKDCNVTAYEAYEYAQNLTLANDGKDIWVFDIDDTALSNLPYYARSDVAFGTIPYNETKFDEWIAKGKMPPMPSVLWLYKKLVTLGFKIVFLSGSSESYREVRISNLENAGYETWEKLMLKNTSDSGLTAIAYKSKRRTELVEEGYRILGNMGDQWSDLLGENIGNRTFKVPDPMYYIA